MTANYEHNTGKPPKITSLKNGQQTYITSSINHHGYPTKHLPTKQ